MNIVFNRYNKEALLFSVRRAKTGAFPSRKLNEMQDYTAIENLDLSTIFLLFEPIAVSIILIMVFFEWRRTKRNHYLLLSLILILSLLKYAYHAYITVYESANAVLYSYRMLMPHTLELIILMFLGPALLNRYIMNTQKTTRLMTMAVIAGGFLAIIAFFIDFAVFPNTLDLQVTHIMLASAQLAVAFYPFVVLTGMWPSLLRFSGFNPRAHPPNIKWLSLPFALIATQKFLSVISLTSPGSISASYASLAGKVFASLFFVSLIVLVYKEIIDELLENYESSITDKLTKVFNRGYLTVRMKEEIFRAMRYNRPLSFAMLDLDFFKQYNDQYGHTQGDVLLQDLTKTIKNELRKTDLLFRYGGEEFSILFLDTKAEKARDVAERIRKSIEKMKAKRPVTISVGLSSIDCGCVADAERSPLRAHEDLIIRADEALYQAKASGRNVVVPCYSSTKIIRTLSPETKELITQMEKSGS